MRKLLVASCLVLLQSASMVFAATPGEIPVGAQLRDVPMAGVFFGQRKFSDYRGKPLVINVWASWCGPCRAEMASLQRLAGQLTGQATVIGVSTDDDQLAAQAFLKSQKVTFSNFIDRNLVLENMLGADRLPLTLLVDAEGRVLQKISGSREWDSPASLSAVSKVLKLKR
jgi:thiol-disulfide isomerase/thioredoxin